MTPPTTSVVAATRPYPWPYDGRVDPHRTALVVTGAQQSFRDMSTDSGDIVDRLAALARDLRSVGVLTIALTHQRRELSSRPGRDVVPRVGDVGTTAITALAAACDVIVHAYGCDGFSASALDHTLVGHGRTHVLLAGFASEITVDSTLRSANDRGLECLVLTDALSPVDPEISARVLHSVTMSGGIFGALGTTAAVRAALDLTPEKDSP